MKRIIFLIFLSIFVLFSLHGATIVVTNSSSSGHGSLSWAINEANTNSDDSNYITFSDSLNFPITIDVPSELPILKGNLTIDALVGNNNYPQVILRGNGNNMGIKINYSIEEQLENVIIRGFVFNNFDRGIIIYNASHNIIEYCYFGTDINGSVSSPDQYHPNFGAIMIIDNSSHNIIRNCLISGNYDGVGLYEPMPPNYNIPGLCEGNIIKGNIFGLDRTGQYAIPNFDAILLINGITGTIIGGDDPQDRNIISGNINDGIRFEKVGDNWTQDNYIIGNYIGLNIDGTEVIGNGAHGIAFWESNDNYASDNIIAGSGSAGIICIQPYSTGNTISSNIIGLLPDGITPAPNNAGINISEHSHNTNIIENTISSNNLYGIRVTADNCQIKGNYVGVSADGNIKRGNGTHGIFIAGAQNTIIGGNYSIDKNIISGNGEYGIVLTNNPSNSSLSRSNHIRGNHIGINAQGNQAIPNDLDGILIHAGSYNNTIGGYHNNYRNIISGNQNSGIRVGGPDTVNNNILGNYIGSGVNLNTNIGNHLDGIRIENGASNNNIGDSDYVYMNHIKYNNRNGITIGTWALDADTLYNNARGNIIAMNSLLGIDLGNDGITQNDSEFYGQGPNKRIFFPVFQHHSASGAGGTSMPDCHIDVYIADRQHGHGQGMEYIGSTLSDAQGFFNINIPSDIIDNHSPLWITGIATDADGNTSEFSANYAIVSHDPNHAPVYRFFNHIRGGHLYTISEHERDTVMQLPEWNYEGPVYKVITGEEENIVQSYRFFNTTTGIHLYTISEHERDTVMQLPEWNYEGPVFFVFAEENSNNIPVYRFFNHARGGHLYTISEHERDTVMQLPEWTYEGITFYVLPYAKEYFKSKK